MLLTQFRFIWPSGYRGEDFQKLTNQKQELLVAAMLVNESGRNEQHLQRTFQGCSLPSFDSFGQAISGEDFIRNQPIRNKNGLWRPCLLTDPDEKSNLYRGPAIDASYQISVHLAKRRPCLLMDRDKMNILQRGPSIDASYQVSLHLAERFQRRRLKCEKLMDDGRQVMAKARIAFGKVS